ncbi:MAG: exodeoxyribonuclease V subunit gamma, partial [Myxococcales bacterium]|nr:exodeoxyribonuclease V subunit gamma [Myxococcales bacterium]
MLHLCYANRLDVLTAPLGAHVGEAQRADPLAPVTIVVPNRSIAQFVRFRLAEQLGVAANLRFDFLERCLRRAATEADPLLRVLDPAALRVLLYSRLRDPGFVAAPALEPVRAWLGAMPEADPEARALELAGQLAGLFDGYARARQGMLRAWAKGPVCGADFADAEGWQRALYRAMFDDRGVARVRGVASTPGTDQLSLFGPPTRWMLLADAIARAEALALPPALHVFGLSYVPPAFAEALRRVAGETALYVYALNPCLEFWEDVDAGFGAQRELDARRRAWARRGEGGEREGADPYDLDRPGDTPALRLWGRPGREYVRLLGDLSGSTFAPGFVDPVQGQPTLLSRLQRDVLLRAPERPPVAGGGEVDDSITFVACPGLRREVEVVADRIWALVTDGAHNGSDPLRFHEIGVLVTDARREAYLTHIEAVFRARHDLPFNMVDRRLAGQSRVVEAVERLLQLPGEAPGYTALVDLVTHPAVAGAEGDTWRGWLEALGVVLAPNREALAGTYVERDVFTWDQVLRRLALGAVSGDVDAPLETDEGAWLPFAVPQEQVGSAGRLIARMRALLEDAAAYGAARLTLSAWAEA